MKQVNWRMQTLKNNRNRTKKILLKFLGFQHSKIDLFSGPKYLDTWRNKPNQGNSL